MMPSACAQRTAFVPAVLAGLGLLVGSGSTPAVAGEAWPQAPFGTPPSFSRTYPHPLYATGRFIPLPQLVREQKSVEPRRQAIPDYRTEAFAALQQLASRGEVGPPESALAYGPAEISPRIEEPHQERQGGAPKARIHRPKSASPHPAHWAPAHPAKPDAMSAANPAPSHPAKPAPARLAQHRERHRSALPPPLNILPPAARTQ